MAWDLQTSNVFLFLLSVCFAPYISLSQSSREKDSGRGQGCDRSLSTRRWYRFTGAAGTQMPTEPVPRLSCGTHAPGWLNGVHPAVIDGSVSRTVCFADFGNECRWKRTIAVVNCSSFYLYKLVPIGFCKLRYCGDDLQGKNPVIVFNHYQGVWQG